MILHNIVGYDGGMKIIAAFLLVAGTVIECVGWLSLSDRLRGRLRLGGLIPIGFAFWLAGAVVLILS